MKIFVCEHFVEDIIKHMLPVSFSKVTFTNIYICPERVADYKCVPHPPLENHKINVKKNKKTAGAQWHVL